MKIYVKASSDVLKQAIKFLNSEVDYSYVKLVRECQERISETSDDEEATKRDYKEIAAEEWGELSPEEADKLFDRIYNALEIVQADDEAAQA